MSWRQLWGLVLMVVVLAVLLTAAIGPDRARECGGDWMDLRTGCR